MVLMTQVKQGKPNDVTGHEKDGGNDTTDF
jgi:hypothetical protein